MKVKCENRDSLIIEERPWFAGIAISLMFLFFTGIALASVIEGAWGGLISLVGSALAALAFYAFVRRTMVIFEPMLGTFKIRQKWVNGYKEEVYSLEKLRYADVETRESYKNNKLKKTFRLILVMSPDNDPLKITVTEHFSGGSGAQKCADAINSLLKSA